MRGGGGAPEGKAPGRNKIHSMKRMGICEKTITRYRVGSRTWTEEQLELELITEDEKPEKNTARDGNENKTESHDQTEVV